MQSNLIIANYCYTCAKQVIIKSQFQRHNKQKHTIVVVQKQPIIEEVQVIDDIIVKEEIFQEVQDIDTTIVKEEIQIIDTSSNKLDQYRFNFINPESSVKIKAQILQIFKLEEFKQDIQSYQFDKDEILDLKGGFVYQNKEYELKKLRNVVEIDFSQFYVQILNYLSETQQISKYYGMLCKDLIHLKQQTTKGTQLYADVKRILCDFTGFLGAKADYYKDLYRPKLYSLLTKTCRTAIQEGQVAFESKNIPIYQTSTDVIFTQGDDNGNPDIEAMQLYQDVCNKYGLSFQIIKYKGVVMSRNKRSFFYQISANEYNFKGLGYVDSAEVISALASQIVQDGKLTQAGIQLIEDKYPGILKKHQHSNLKAYIQENEYVIDKKNQLHTHLMTDEMQKQEFLTQADLQSTVVNKLKQMPINQFAFQYGLKQSIIYKLYDDVYKPRDSTRKYVFGFKCPIDVSEIEENKEQIDYLRTAMHFTNRQVTKEYIPLKQSEIALYNLLDSTNANDILVSVEQVDKPRKYVVQNIRELETQDKQQVVIHQIIHPRISNCFKFVLDIDSVKFIKKSEFDRFVTDIKENLNRIFRGYNTTKEIIYSVVKSDLFQIEGKELTNSFHLYTNQLVRFEDYEMIVDFLNRMLIDQKYDSSLFNIDNFISTTGMKSLRMPGFCKIISTDKKQQIEPRKELIYNEDIEFYRLQQKGKNLQESYNMYFQTKKNKPFKLLSLNQQYSGFNNDIPIEIQEMCNDLYSIKQIDNKSKLVLKQVNDINYCFVCKKDHSKKQIRPLLISVSNKKITVHCFINSTTIKINRKQVEQINYQEQINNGEYAIDMGIQPTTHSRFSDEDVHRMTLKKINYITGAVGQGKSTTVMKTVDLLQQQVRSSRFGCESLQVLYIGCRHSQINCLCADFNSKGETKYFTLEQLNELQEKQKHLPFQQQIQYKTQSNVFCQCESIMQLKMFVDHTQQLINYDIVIIDESVQIMNQINSKCKDPYNLIQAIQTFVDNAKHVFIMDAYQTIEVINQYRSILQHAANYDEQIFYSDMQMKKDCNMYIYHSRINYKQIDEQLTDVQQIDAQLIDVQPTENGPDQYKILAKDFQMPVSSDFTPTQQCYQQFCDIVVEQMKKQKTIVSFISKKGQLKMLKSHLQSKIPDVKIIVLCGDNEDIQHYKTIDGQNKIGSHFDYKTYLYSDFQKHTEDCDIIFYTSTLLVGVSSTQTNCVGVHLINCEITRSYHISQAIARYRLCEEQHLIFLNTKGQTFNNDLTSSCEYLQRENTKYTQFNNSAYTFIKFEQALAAISTQKCYQHFYALSQQQGYTMNVTQLKQIQPSTFQLVKGTESQDKLPLNNIILPITMCYINSKQNQIKVDVVQLINIQLANIQHKELQQEIQDNFQNYVDSYKKTVSSLDRSNIQVTKESIIKQSHFSLDINYQFPVIPKFDVNCQLYSETDQPNIDTQKQQFLKDIQQYIDPVLGFDMSILCIYYSKKQIFTDIAGEHYKQHLYQLANVDSLINENVNTFKFLSQMQIQEGQITIQQRINGIKEPVKLQMFTAKDIRKIGINARMDLISNCCALRLHTKRLRSADRDGIAYWCEYKPEMIRKFQEISIDDIIEYKELDQIAYQANQAARTDNKCAIKLEKQSNICKFFGIEKGYNRQDVTKEHIEAVYTDKVQEILDQAQARKDKKEKEQQEKDSKKAIKQQKKLDKEAKLQQEKLEKKAKKELNKLSKNANVEQLN